MRSADKPTEGQIHINSLYRYIVQLNVSMYVSDDIEYMVVADYIENQGFIYPAIGNRILIKNGTTSSADAFLASTFIVCFCSFIFTLH